MTDAQFHVTQFRGFERIVQGRPIHEMPSIMARICGICPVSHLIASAKACDEILAVEPPPTGRRPAPRDEPRPDRPVERAQLLPPVVARPPVRLRRRPGQAQHHRRRRGRTRQLARDGIGVRRFGQQIIEWLGGKRIHPVLGRAGRRRRAARGGDPRPDPGDDPRGDRRDRAGARLVQVGAASGGRTRPPRSATSRSAFMGLVDRDGNVDHYDGWLRVMDADGRPARRPDRPARLPDYLGEAVEPWSYLKSTYWKALGYPDGVYRVGPLARVIVADQMGTPRADAELDEFRRRLGRVPSSSFHYHYARLIDTLHAAERIEELLRGPDILSPRVRSFAGVNRNEGIGVSEAPRGTLHPPLPGRRRRDRPVGEPRHRDRPQQPGDEPERPPGRPALRQERPADRADAQPGRGGHPLLRPVPVVLDPRAGRDGAPSPAHRPGRSGPRRADRDDRRRRSSSATATSLRSR